MTGLYRKWLLESRTHQLLSVARVVSLGMMLLLKGLSLVISGTKPIYFNDVPEFTLISQDSLIGYLIPALPIPNAVLILFIVAAAGAFPRTLEGWRALPGVGAYTAAAVASIVMFTFAAVRRVNRGV